MLSNEDFEQFKAERNAQGGYHQEHTTNIKDLLDIHNSTMQESARRAEEMKQAQHENIITMIEIFIPIISLIILTVFLSKKYKTLAPIIFDKIFRYISIIASLALIAFFLYAPATSHSVLKKEDIIIIIPVLTLACINLFTLLKLSNSSNEDSPHSTGTNMLSNMIRRKNLEDEIKTLEAEKRLKELKEELHKTTDDIETNQKNIIPPSGVQDSTESQEITPSQDSCTNNPISHSQNSTIHASNEELPQNSPPELTDLKYTKDEAATLAPILSFTGLFSPKGRRSNSKAFIVGLITILLFYGMGIFIRSTSDKYLILFLMFTPLFTYIGAINLVKRLHDINRSGYWVFLWLSLWIIPVAINMIESNYIGRSDPQNYISSFFWLAHLFVALFIAVKPGTIGLNQYGPDPADKPVKPLDIPPKN